MVTAFVDMVGLLMVLPQIPFLARALGGSDLMVGLLVSSFAVAQLLSAPFWGKLSDRYGRRPALLVGLFGSAIAYVVFAFADSLWLLFLARIVQGAGGGTTGVIQAYVADATAPEQRARSLGWLSAATNLGVTIGPVFGSFSLVWGRSSPGLIAAGLCVVNMAFAFKYLTETHDLRARAASRKGGTSSLQAVWRVLTRGSEAAPRLILIYAIAMGAFMGMNGILALFLADEFGVTEKTIYYFFTYTGAISVVTRALVLGWMVDRFGEARLSRLGSVLLATGLATIPLARNHVMLALAIALVPLGTAFTFPCVTALLSRVISPSERGLYMGVQQTFGGVARVIGPTGAALAYGSLGHGVPFWISSSLVLGTIFLGLGMEEYTKPKQIEPIPG
jgi:multidrug resistance protein